MVEPDAKRLKLESAENDETEALTENGGTKAVDCKSKALPNVENEINDVTEKDNIAVKSEVTDFKIEELPNSIFKLSMHVAKSFFKGILGPDGNTKKRIEKETETDITIPKYEEIVAGKSDTSDIVVQGKTKENVAKAKEQINILINALRRRQRPTHFYGIALNCGEIIEKYKQFKQEVLAAELNGIDESFFTHDCCIHLTFGTCTLRDTLEIDKAKEILQSCSEFLTDKKPMEIHVAGLEIMNTNASAVRVLYAKIESAQLQEFANNCFHKFNDSGYGFDNYQNDCVKLHMTLMIRRGKKRKSFDAREILKKWNNFDFGKIITHEILLCVIGSSTKDAFYKVAGTLKF